MNNNIFQMNKIFFKWLFISTLFAVPFFVSAQIVPPVVGTGNYVAINDYSAVKIIGIAGIGGDVSSDVWVEWGTGGSYFSNRTSKQTVTTFSNVVFYISNINKNTKYYYRVVAQNSAGRSFGDTRVMLLSKNIIQTPPEDTTTQTSNNNNNNNYNNYSNYNNGQNYYYNNFSINRASPIAVTKLPQNITQNSATIKGLALPGGNITTFGWFEWGTTRSLGKETLHGNIGASTSMGFSSTLVGLSPNTTYYFRAVIQNQRGISKGNVFSFKTGKVRTPAVYTAVAKKPASVSKNKQKEQVKKEPVKEIKKEESKNGQEDQSATAGLLGKKFTPDTLIGWLIFTVLLLVIFILSYHLYGMSKKQKNKYREDEDIDSEIEIPE